VSAGKNAKRLVVLIPGMGSTYRDWKTLITRIQEDPGDPVEQEDAPKLSYGSGEAHWMTFEYGITVTTLGRRDLAQSGNLETLSHQLRILIHEQWLKYGWAAGTQGLPACSWCRSRTGKLAVGKAGKSDHTICSSEPGFSIG
jgi:hypothetical protein